MVTYCNYPVQVSNIWRPTQQYELYHYGVKGMKWGVRKFQPYANTGSKGLVGSSRGTFSSSLNRVEGETAKFKYRQARAIRKSRTTRNAAKSDKWRAKAEAYGSAVKKGEADTKRLLSDAKKSGYRISSRETMSYQRTGRMAAAWFVGGVPGTLVLGAYDAYQGHHHGYESVGVVKKKRYTVD